MTETHRVVLGDRGEFVVPAEVRARAGLVEGTPLMILETPDGLVLLTREQILDRVRADLAGADLVAELLAERRRAAMLEDAG
jgi:AbrB family looped-hinge helix DNA binding protein